MKRVYVTRWLGHIKEMEGEWTDGGTLFRAKTGERTWDYVLLDPKDVHETWYAAVAAALALRDKRVASLRKQIAKLEKLSFDTEGES